MDSNTDYWQSICMPSYTVKVCMYMPSTDSSFQSCLLNSKARLRSMREWVCLKAGFVPSPGLSTLVRA